MFTIQAENPSIKNYIEDMGREKIEELVLNYLKLKAQFHKSSIKKEDTKPSYKDFGISEETHLKLLALKPKNSTKAKKMGQFRDNIAKKLDKYYSGKSINEIRDEYFISKGYL